MEPPTMLAELFASLPVTEKEGFEPSISVFQQKRWCGCLTRVLGTLRVPCGAAHG